MVDDNKAKEMGDENDGAERVTQALGGKMECDKNSYVVVLMVRHGDDEW